MKRFLVLLLTGLLLAAPALGCGDKDKGRNSNKDKPMPADKGG